MAEVSRHLKRLERRFELSEYLKQYDDVKDHGPNVSMTCPVCEKPDKLWVLLDEKVTSRGTQPPGSFVCYYCRDVEGIGLGQGPLALIQWMESLSFVDAVKVLVAGGSYEAEADFVALVERAFATITEAAEDYEPLPSISWPAHFRRINEVQSHEYLVTRGISVKKAMRYQLGFCNKGYYKNRLILPTFHEGRLVSYQARYLRKKPPKGVKKTWFPKGTKTGRMLFNYDNACKKKTMVITEDPFSAMAVGSRAVATFGTSISQGQLELLLRADAEELTLLWDRDALGKAWDLVESLNEHWRVRIAVLPDERDIDEHTKESRKEIIGLAQLVSPIDALARKVRWQLRNL